MGDGSMTSILPVVTLSVFGLEKGPQVYGLLFSIFGVASIAGLVIVYLFQAQIGYEGMLLVCLGFSFLSAVFTYFYRFD